MEIFVDDDTKLTLHGLQQYFVRLEEGEKNRKLNDLLDALEFNQVGVYLYVFTCIMYIHFDYTHILVPEYIHITY